MGLPLRKDFLLHMGLLLRQRKDLLRMGSLLRLRLLRLLLPQCMELLLRMGLLQRALLRMGCALHSSQGLYLRSGLRQSILLHPKELNG